MDSWILLAVLGNVALSGASLLDKTILYRLSATAFLVLSELVWVPIIGVALLLSPTFPFFQKFFGPGFSLVYPDGQILMEALVPGWCAILSLFFYYRAMRVMIPSQLLMIAFVVSSLTAALLGMKIRGIPFASFEWLAFILLLGGGWLASFLLYARDAKERNQIISPGFYDIFISGVGFGTYAVLLHNSGKNIPWLSVFFWQGVAGISVTALFLFFSFSKTWKELRDVFLGGASEDSGSPTFSLQFLGTFGLNKLLGFGGVYAVNFATILGNAAFIPAFGGVKYVVTFCYEHLRGGYGFWGRFRLMFTLRMFFMLIAAALMTLGILILAFHAPRGGA